MAKTKDWEDVPWQEMAQEESVMGPTIEIVEITSIEELEAWANDQPHLKEPK